MQPKADMAAKECGFNQSDERQFTIIIILALPPVAFQSNCALSMPGTADGGAISRCQVLSRARSVHHGADQ